MANGEYTRWVWVGLVLGLYAKARWRWWLHPRAQKEWNK